MAEDNTENSAFNTICDKIWSMPLARREIVCVSANISDQVAFRLRRLGCKVAIEQRSTTEGAAFLDVTWQ